VHWDVKRSDEYGRDACVRVFVTDISRVLVMISYSVLSDVVSGLDWLQFQQKIRFDFLLITGYDAQYDILQAERLEHTVAVPCTPPSKVKDNLTLHSFHHVVEPSERLLMLERDRCQAICQQEMYYKYIPRTDVLESTTRYDVQAVTLCSYRRYPESVSATSATAISQTVNNMSPYERNLNSWNNNRYVDAVPLVYIVNVINTASIDKMKIDVDLLRYTSVLADIEAMIREGSSLLCDIVYSHTYHRDQRHLVEKRIVWIRKVSVKDEISKLLSKHE